MTADFRTLTRVTVCRRTGTRITTTLTVVRSDGGKLEVIAESVTLETVPVEPDREVTP